MFTNFETDVVLVVSCPKDVLSLTSQVTNGFSRSIKLCQGRRPRGTFYEGTSIIDIFTFELLTLKLEFQL